MSKIEVDTIAPQSGTTLTVGESGDTITVPSGATFDASNATTTLPATVVTTDGTQTLTNKTINASQLTGTITPSDNTVSLAKLTATGTKDSTTFLRGDNTFAEPAVGLTKLASTTVTTAVANVEFDSTYIADYSTYFLTISSFSAATDGWDLDIAFYNGATKISLNHCHNWKNMNDGTQNIGLGGSSLNHHRVVQDGEASSSRCAGLVWIVLNNNKTTEGGGAYGFGSTLNQTGDYYGYDSESIFTADYTLNKIQILDGAGSNIDSGTFTLYGVTK